MGGEEGAPWEAPRRRSRWDGRPPAPEYEVARAPGVADAPEDDGRAALHAALDRDPSDRQARLALADALAADGLADRAAFQRAFALDPRPWVFKSRRLAVPFVGEPGALFRRHHKGRSRYGVFWQIGRRHMPPGLRRAVADLLPGPHAYPTRQDAEDALFAAWLLDLRRRRKKKKP